MRRQFIAVIPNGLETNPELKNLMSKLRRTMDGRKTPVRWVQPSLWHVTLQFLGDPENDSRRDDLISVLTDWDAGVSGLTLRLQHLGAFPSIEEGRVLWIGVQENQDFIDLQSRLGAHLLKAGFTLSDRAFNPHLTLARFRNAINLRDLVQLGGRKHFGDYPIRDLVLFDSVLQGNILRYVPRWRKTLSDSDLVRKE